MAAAWGVSTMAKLLPSSREIKEQQDAIRQKREGIREAILRLDAEIDRLPAGEDKQSLREVQDELKQQSGLFDG